MPLVSLLFSATWTLHNTKKIDVLETVNVKTEHIAIVSKLSSVLFLSTKSPRFKQDIKWGYRKATPGCNGLNLIS